jgi:hypothetical protein
MMTRWHPEHPAGSRTIRQAGKPAATVLSVRIVTSREDFPARMFFLPLPATERGEDRGEGHSSFTPQTRLLSSRAGRRGSVWLRLCRAALLGNPPSACARKFADCRLSAPLHNRSHL